MALTAQMLEQFRALVSRVRNPKEAQVLLDVALEASPGFAKALPRYVCALDMERVREAVSDNYRRAVDREAQDALDFVIDELADNDEFTSGEFNDNLETAIDGGRLGAWGKPSGMEYLDGIAYHCAFQEENLDSVLREGLANTDLDANVMVIGAGRGQRFAHVADLVRSAIYLAGSYLWTRDVQAVAEKKLRAMDKGGR
jgi:hypothetical protein